MRSPLRGLIAALLLSALPLASNAAVFVGVSVGIAPPALPVYVQPPCPAPGYIWIPGYWAWDEVGGYYWVPGTWALAPVVGFLWTPGYWGWQGGFYMWHAGYWGPHIGFYGGINYGFGYFGHGYEGGYWRGNQFYYNRSVTNINTTNITNVYNRTVVNNTTVTRVSFNGGSGGVAARPSAAEMAVEHDRHIGFTPVQRQHEQMARSDTSLRASVNGGHPAIAATARPAVFSGHGVVAAHGARLAPHAAEAPAASLNRMDRPPANRAGMDRPPANRGDTVRADRPPERQQQPRPERQQPPRPIPQRPVMNEPLRERGGAPWRAPQPAPQRQAPQREPPQHQPQPQPAQHPPGQHQGRPEEHRG